MPPTGGPSSTHVAQTASGPQRGQTNRGSSVNRSGLRCKASTPGAARAAPIVPGSPGLLKVRTAKRSPTPRPKTLGPIPAHGARHQPALPLGGDCPPSRRATYFPYGTRSARPSRQSRSIIHRADCKESPARVATSAARRVPTLASRTARAACAVLGSEALRRSREGTLTLKWQASRPKRRVTMRLSSLSFRRWYAAVERSTPRARAASPVLSPGRRTTRSSKACRVGETSTLANLPPMLTASPTGPRTRYARPMASGWAGRPS